MAKITSVLKKFNNNMVHSKTPNKKAKINTKKKAATGPVDFTKWR